jgi:hypothetical protein
MSRSSEGVLKQESCCVNSKNPLPLGRGVGQQNPKRLDLAMTVQLSGNVNIISIDLNQIFRKKQRKPRTSGRGQQH